MENNTKVCLFCKRDEQEVPLLSVDFKNKNYWICPQHMPTLIHNPSQLEGMLPGAEDLTAG